jgi:uncharacterized protein
MSAVTDNVKLSRFELTEEGHTAFANYRRNGPEIVIPHVEAPPHLRGKGTADRLMRGIADIARHEGLTIVPLCSYAATWFRRHRDQQDVL